MCSVWAHLIGEGSWSKVDAALPGLGSGIKPADRPLCGTAYPEFIKERAGTLHFMKNVPALSYPIGISSIARITHLYSGGRVWAELTEPFSAANAYFVYRKLSRHV